ncbi:MAG: aminotransferase class V-fold PLP-dependent enzyme [Gemmatimonadales bacterium]
MIACQRDKFDIPAGVNYLNCGYMSPMLRAAVAAGQVGMARKLAPWNITSEDFFEATEHTRLLFATIVGTSAHNIAIVPSASYGLSVAANNLPLEPGSRVVLLAEQFPSNVYPWVASAQDAGAELSWVMRPEDGDWTSAVVQSIDDRTGLAAVSACHWTDGARIDLVRVSARCKEVGAALVVDGTQTVGATPFDVKAIDPDFMVVAAYKWLLGPYSVAFLYANQRRQDGEPIEYTWMTRRKAEDFARLADYRDEFRIGARRFDVGEFSNFALLPAVDVALAQILEWSPEHIAETLRALTDRAIAAAESRGYGTPADQLRSPHMVGITIQDGPPDVVQQLAERGVYVSQRGDSLRISPYLHNTAADIDRLFAELDSLGAT